MPPRAKNAARRANAHAALEEAALVAAHATESRPEDRSRRSPRNLPDEAPTAARAEIRHLQAAVTRFLQIIETIRRDHMFYHDDYGASIPLAPLDTHIPAMMNLHPPQPVTRPFSGQGHRLDE